MIKKNISNVAKKKRKNSKDKLKSIKASTTYTRSQVLIKK